MKKFTRATTLLLALLMVLSLTLTAFAEESVPTGKITITNASAGQTYTAYKVFDATYNETTHTTAYTVKAGALYDAVKAAENEDEEKLFVVADTADAYGNYAVSMVTGKDQEVLAWLKVNESLYTVAGTANPTAGNTVEFDVAYGYYYISSTLGATVTVNTNTPSVNLIDKNTSNPGPGEDIDGDGNKAEYKYIVSGSNNVDSISVSVGDTVNFKVVFNATNFITTGEGIATTTNQVKEYIITDHPSGIKINNSSIVVNVGGTNLASTAYSVVGNVITIPWATSATAENVTTWTSIYTSPVTVTITYSAEIIALTGASNSVDIDYRTTDMSDSDTSVDINPDPIDPDPDDPNVTPTDPDTTIVNYTLTVKKTDGANSTTILEGAEFKLYKQTVDKDNNSVLNLVTLVKSSETVKDDEGNDKTVEFYRPATTEDTTTVEYFVAGNMEVRGLGTGTYYLEEVKAPAGYNKLTEKKKVDVGTQNLTEVVVNQAGTVLPSTGGIGTTMFYTIGGLMALAAFVLLVTKRRMRDVA